MGKLHFIEHSQELLEKSNIEILSIKKPQWFNPIYNLYVDDTSKIPKTKYSLNNFIDTYDPEKEDCEIQINDDDPYIKTFLSANIKNNHTNIITKRDVFAKFISIIDPLMYAIKENNNNETHLLSSPYNQMCSEKINNFQNAAYIDGFFTLLGSKLTEGGRCPCFPLYYGTFSGLKDDYLIDITEDYDELKYNSHFRKNKQSKFELIEKKYDCGDSDSENDSFENDSSNLELLDEEFIGASTIDTNLLLLDEFNETYIESGEDLEGDVIEIDENYQFNDIINDAHESFIYMKVNDFPVQCVLMEKLEGTMESLYELDLDENVWKAYFFQIIFGLAVAQKHYNFVHNDLHSENIMYVDTKLEYLYYEFEGTYFKIPTYGRILKIIDFGRATFNHNNYVFFSDVFDEDGDAEGQYDYPDDINSKKCKIKPNYSFDLARLASTIIEDFMDKPDLYKLMRKWITDKYGYCLINEPDDFDIYIKIAKTIKNAIPKKQLKHNIFKPFVVKKEFIEELSFIYKY